MSQPAQRSSDPAIAPEIRRFRSDLDSAFPGRVRRVVLFGSRARGDCHDDSDWDVAVFLDNYDRSTDRRRLSELAYPYLLQGMAISPIGLPSDGKGTGVELLHNLNIEGRPL
jgi:hypothetical protein